MKESRPYPKQNMQKTTLSALMVLFLGLPVFSDSQGTGDEKARPNIIYILTDDLGYGDVDSQGFDKKIKTPNIDRLATEGMSLAESHSSSAVCTPSRYSILTGRYNWRTTLKSDVLYGFSLPLIEPGRMSVADLLRAQGYKTACVGKWHLGLDWARLSSGPKDKIVESSPDDADDGGPAKKTAGRGPGPEGIDFTKPVGGGPTSIGFDSYFGIAASLDMPPYTYIENDRVAALPTIAKGYLAGTDGKKTRVGPQAPGFQAVDVLPTLTKRVVDIIDQSAADAKNGKPFFLYFAVPTPHTPIAPTPEWQGKSGLNYYADYVMETDAYVGQVLDALDRDGLTKNTIVIFTSDNGCSPEADFPFLKAHGHDPSDGRRGYKADIYDGGHRIPLIVRWPGKVAAGSKTDAFICLGDFMATCADLLHVKLPDNAAEDSISFLPLLLGHDSQTARQDLVESSIDGSFGIREGKWKLALCPGSGGWSYPRPGKDSTAGMPAFQLFDLAADPAETTNVIKDHPDIVQRLGHMMRDYIVNGRSTPGAPQPNTPIKHPWKQIAWMEQFK